MSDTSLVFNLVARDNTEQGLSSAQERFNTVATGIGTGVAAALGVGLAESLDMTAANAKLQAQLGLGPQQAAEVSKVAASVYENAWGDSIQTVNEAVRGVYNNIGDVSQVEGGLEGVTTKALALSETFDQEVGPTTAAVGQLIRTGLAKDANEAFDIITRGFQTAANKADDFLDTINEYSTQFRRLGLDGQTATGLLHQGLKAGARDADQVADAIGQFGEIALAGGTSVDAAFKSIGLNSGEMAKMIGAGGDSAQKALQLTTDALRGTKDETVKLNAAGTLFGDPGKIMGDALYALNPAAAAAASGMDKAAGSTDKLVGTVGGSAASALEEFKRKAMHHLTEVTGGFVQFAMKNRAVFEPLAYVLAGLAATVLVVRGAMMTYSAVSSVVAGAHAIMTSSTWGVIGTWLRMNAIGIGAYLRIGASAVASAMTTAAAWTGSALASIGTWILSVIRAGATAAVQFALMAARAIVWAATMAAQWLIAMGPIGWVIAVLIGLTVLVIAKWNTIKAYTAAAWNWVWTKVRGAVSGVLAAVGYLSALPGRVSGWFSRMKDAAVQKALALAAWVRSLPGRITSALGGLGRLLWNAGSSVISGFINGLKSKFSSVKNTLGDLTSNLTSWKGPEDVDARILRSAGQLVIGGFQLGIDDQIPALRAQLQGLTGDIPSMVTQAAPLTAGMAPILGSTAGSGVTRVIVDVRGADEDLKRLFRKLVRIDGQGSAQTAFGRT